MVIYLELGALDCSPQIIHFTQTPTISGRSRAGSGNATDERAGDYAWSGNQKGKLNRDGPLLEDKTNRGLIF
ncbi:hypothetical protein [Pseudomonas fluorescens]|jgi:hypothetical protein|uniref:hypothetical protein n=1 Tax=Pseudomonas fluorescens TaxID=294 RepID=UPI0011CE60DD|nr:hypothetical protein [Pseudomonas fluorescens]